jgi:hypothetical protein
LQRHSSPGWFIGLERKSQESLSNMGPIQKNDGLAYPQLFKT